MTLLGLELYHVLYDVTLSLHHMYTLTLLGLELYHVLYDVTLSLHHVYT
jgi:hypothetical protein